MVISTFQMINVVGIMTGPVVDVNIDDDMIEPGETTTVNVLVQDYDGDTYTPLDLREVTLTVSMGSFEPESAISDIDGRCSFTYHAPQEIDGPTEIKINATAENGALDIIGSDTILVTYRLVGEIIGPLQLLSGSGEQNYILKVTGGDEPVGGVSVMPLLLGEGTLGAYGRSTNKTGESTLKITPSDSTGQISIVIQLGSSHYLRSTASLSINVVDEMAPLKLELGAPIRLFQNWGCGGVRARVVRGESYIPGQEVHFHSDFGYFMEESVISDMNGWANATFVASSDQDYDWQVNVTINISTSDGVETAYLEENAFIGQEESPGIYNPNKIVFKMKLKSIPVDGQFNGQLFSGEELIQEPRIFDDNEWVNRNPYVVDMNLDFELKGPDGNVVYTKTIGSGIDSTYEEIKGERYVYKHQSLSVYQVPNDPIEGNYSFVYKLKSKNGVHTYKEFTETWLNDGYFGEWIEDYTISIHDQGKDDWTFIYYFAGDNDLTDSMDHELDSLENKAPDGEFKVFVMFDRDDLYDDFHEFDGYRWDGARKWDLEVGREKSLEMGSLNSGSQDTLVDFMKWVSYCSPSGHYCLVLNDHGRGYKGMCYDYHAPNRDLDNYDLNFMSPDEIGDALHDFGRDRREVEFTVLSACGMSTIEAVARISPYTQYIVAPQQPTYDDHGLATEKVLQNLEEYDWDISPPGPIQVSTDFINGFIQESGGTDHDSTVCLINSEHVVDLADELNETFRKIYNNWDLLGECFSTAFDQTTRVPGPEPGEFENGDLGEFLEKLRDEVLDYIMDPTARSVFNQLQNCISLFDGSVQYLHAIDDLNGLNIYMPQEPIPVSFYNWINWDYSGIYDRYHDFYRFCLRMNSGGDYQPQGGDGEEDDFTPMEPVDGYVIDDDSNGLGEKVVLNITQPQESSGQILVIDLFHFSGNGPGDLSSTLKRRLVMDMDDLKEHPEISVPSMGRYTVMGRVIGPDNRILQKMIIGNYSMEERGPWGKNIDFEIKASTTTLKVGEELQLNVVIPEGDNNTRIFWDFDHRDGVFFDSREMTPSVKYMKPGNVTVTCVASNEDSTTIRTIYLKIEPCADNNQPIAGMTYSMHGNKEIHLDAMELSSDPDGDAIYYRFNFGDGNWTDWMEEGVSSHRYTSNGTYNCSLRVMDNKGNVSERFFLTVGVDDRNDMVENTDGNGEKEHLTISTLTIIVICSIFVVLLLIAISIFLISRRKNKISPFSEE